MPDQHPSPEQSASPIKAPRAPRRRQTEVDKARQLKNHWKVRAHLAEAEARELQKLVREMGNYMRQTLPGQEPHNDYRRRSELLEKAEEWSNG